MANVKRTKRPKFVETTVGSLLDAGDVISLRDEIGEWKDNLEGANMSHLPKYEELESCFDALEQVADDLESLIDDLVGVLDKSIEGKAVLERTVQVRPSKTRASRADRLGEATGGIETALNSIEEVFGEQSGGTSKSGNDQDGAPLVFPDAAEVIEKVEEIREKLEELDVVDFPGMY